MKTNIFVAKNNKGGGSVYVGGGEGGGGEGGGGEKEGGEGRGGGCVLLTV